MEKSPPVVSVINRHVRIIIVDSMQANSGVYTVYVTVSFNIETIL